MLHILCCAKLLLLQIFGIEFLKRYLIREMCRSSKMGKNYKITPLYWLGYLRNILLICRETNSHGSMDSYWIGPLSATCRCIDHLAILF